MPDNLPDFLDKNMATLKKNHPHVWEILTHSPPEPIGEICPALNGKPNLWVNDREGNRVPLHIPDDPEIEVRQFLAAVAGNFSGIITLTGMGLGYAPLALIQQRPTARHLAIFEPNAGIFLQALHALDLTPLLTDPRVTFGIGPNQEVRATMRPAEKALQLENIQNLQHLPSFSLNPDEYKKLHEEIYNHCSSFNIEGNTVAHLGRDFLGNRLRHLNSMHHDRLLLELAEKFTGLPVILVAAGPSLDKNVHLLKEAKEKALIIAVDSALPTLIAHGIMPHLIGTIDPLELIFEKVAGVAPQVHDTSLLCMSWASSKMIKFFPADQIFWCFGAKPIETWMVSLMGDNIVTPGASTVAHLNFLAAIIMGCSPIVFVGQDLAYSSTKSHSSHAVLQTKDLGDALQEGNENAVWLDGIDGGKVLSDRGFLSNKLFFENMIKHQKGLYINATEGGAHIEGTEVLPLRTVLDRYCTNPIEINEKLRPTDEQKQARRRERFLHEFDRVAKLGRDIIKILEKTDILSRNILQHFDKTPKISVARYRSFSDLPSSIRKKVEELDKLNKRLDNESGIWPLLQEVTMAGLRRSEQQKHVIDSLANNPDRYVEWLQKNIQRFLQINEIRREVLPLLTDTLANDVTFLKAEEKLLTTLRASGSDNDDTETILALVQLYYEAGNLNLARPLIRRLTELRTESAEVLFLQGWVAAHYTEYAQAEAFFTKAVATDQDYATKIEAFRQKQGDAYIKYAAFFKEMDKATSRRLLIKGLRYAPKHAGIGNHLVVLCDQALNAIKQAPEPKNAGKAMEVIDGWLADLAASQRLAEILGPERIAQFHRARGIILAEKTNYSEAIEAFNNALRLTPDDPTLHINLTDMYFALGQYPQGITHLDKAVSLDSAYVVYWEGIGDSLAEAAQHEDALAAYEKCFTILPERVHLLKKIGDCYMATGQLEAAREAYLHLKEKMQAIEATTTSVQ